MRRYVAQKEHGLSPEAAQDKLEAILSIRDHYAEQDMKRKRDRNTLVQIVFPLLDADTGHEVQNEVMPSPHVEYFEGDLWLVSQNAVNLDSIIRTLSQ